MRLLTARAALLACAAHAPANIGADAAARGCQTWRQVCEEAGDYEAVREDLEAMMPGASAHGSFAMALVQREQEWATDCARCGQGFTETLEERTPSPQEMVG